MAEQNTSSDIAAMSFEDALQELEKIVQSLETGRVRLDEAVAAYERGSLLKRHCEQRLAEARAKVEKITIGPGSGPDGGVGTAPAEFG